MNDDRFEFQGRARSAVVDQLVFDRERGTRPSWTLRLAVLAALLLIVVFGLGVKDARAEVVTYTFSYYDFCPTTGTSAEAVANALKACYLAMFPNDGPWSFGPLSNVLSGGQYNASFVRTNRYSADVTSFIGTCPGGCTGAATPTDPTGTAATSVAIIPPLSLEDAATWGFLFGGIMLTAWAFKMLIRALGTDSPTAVQSFERDDS